VRQSQERAPGQDPAGDRELGRRGEARSVQERYRYRYHCLAGDEEREQPHRLDLAPAVLGLQAQGGDGERVLKRADCRHTGPGCPGLPGPRVADELVCVLTDPIPAAVDIPDVARRRIRG
jgi:hypothetical protein